MLNICRLLRQVKIEPTVRVQPMASVRTLSVTTIAESRVEKAWTERRMKRHQYMRIEYRRKEEFDADRHFRFQKSVARKKNFVDKWVTRLIPEKYAQTKGFNDFEIN